MYLHSNSLSLEITTQLIDIPLEVSIFSSLGGYLES